MKAEELQVQLRSAHPPKLLHVLPPEIFAAARVPGSQNACVYETAFLDQVKALGLAPAAPLVVYGAGEGSLDAATAGDKLCTAGYSQVEPFEGGLAAWTAAGLPLEGTGLLPQHPVPDGTFRIDTAESVIRWTGRNLFNHHSGTVRLADGEIRVKQRQLASARFTIDMASIACEDLADSAMNAMLLAHLCTTDFFDVEHHPTAEFVADAAEPTATCTDGTPNHLLRGTFTLRGISQPLEFPVLIAVADDGQHLSGQGVLELDRTAYGSHYGSGKLFRFLGPHLVNDHPISMLKSTRSAKPKLPSPWLALTVLSLAIAVGPRAVSVEPARPVVGAIRWDGWLVEGSVGRAVSKSLTPPHWSYRLPFFARVREDGSPELRGDTAEVMTAEIAAARTAHLDYWAFLTYDEADPMTRGLQLYLANPRRADVNFCIISETARWHRGNVAALAERFAKLMAEPGYQRVAGGRPLFYFLHHNLEPFTRAWGNPAGFREAVDVLKAAAAIRGLPAPYFAVMTYDVNGAKALLDAAGFDAISAYAFQRGQERAPYARLTSDLEDFWEIQRGTGASVIPLAMAGWDRRPRVENPVPWEHFGGTMDKYYATPTPDELATHIRTAVQWTRDHATTCPAQAVIVYAWNEFDEGGWLCPTRSEGAARVDALGRTLR